MNDELEALLELLELKDERRTGWVLRNVDAPESVAAHTWGAATLCLLYAGRAGIDRERAVAMGVVHDLAEARTGDVPTRAEDSRQTVSAAEKEAMKRRVLTELLAPFQHDQDDETSEGDGDDLDDGNDRDGRDDENRENDGDDRDGEDVVLSLWEEYEARETPTAEFVEDMDLIDNCLQALKYERAERYDDTEPNESFSEYEDLDEFFATAAPRVRTATGEALFERIKGHSEEEIGRPCQI
jgi:putative hydrolase of HD superfamily